MDLGNYIILNRKVTKFVHQQAGFFQFFSIFLTPFCSKSITAQRVQMGTSVNSMLGKEYSSRELFSVS